MRNFSSGDGAYAALIVLGSDEFDAMEVVEFSGGQRGKLILEFRMTKTASWLEYCPSSYRRSASA